MSCKKLVTHVESHASAESARERRKTLYLRDKQQQQQHKIKMQEIH